MVVHPMIAYVDMLNVSIAQNDTTICEGDSVVLSLDSVLYNSITSTAPLTGSLTNGLVAYYPFNGNANDESINTNNGTVNGATLTFDRFGNHNSAYEFNGNDYIDLGQNINLNSFTFSVWIKTNSYGAIISKHRESSFNSSYEMQMLNSGNCNIYFTASPNSVAYSISEITPSNDGNWHHVVGSYDNTNLRIYKDGELEKQGYNPANIYQTTLPTLIGAFRNNSNTGYSAYFTGIIDDVVIYDRALSNFEIQELYAGNDLSYQWSTGDTTASITPSPSQTTTYYVTVSNGITTCQDSVTVTVNPTHEISIDSTSCDSIQWAGNWLASSGTYVDTLQNVSGCDSIITLNLTINNSASSDTTATACDSLVWYGNTYISTGTYTETLQTINSCDSVVTLNLTIYNSAIGDTVATACDSLVWRGVTYISSGTYSDTLQTINGCDSVVTLNLTINPSPTIELGDDTTLICEGSSITLDVGSGFSSYAWSDASTAQTLDISAAGIFRNEQPMLTVVALVIVW